MAFGVTTYTYEPIGIMSANVASINQGLGGLSAYSTLGIQTYRYDLFKNKALEIDTKIQTIFMGPESDKKGQIVSIGGSTTTFIDHPKYYVSEISALAGASALYGLESEIQTTGVSADVVVGLSVSISAANPGSYVVGDPVVNGSGTTVGVVIVPRTLTISGSFPVKYRGRLEFKQYAPVSIGDTLTASGVTTTAGAIQYIGISSVYDDFIAVTKFPNLEPPDDTTSNPFGGRQTIKATSSNAGIGAGNTYYGNSVVGSTYGNYVDTVDTLPFRGDVLAFDTTSGSTEATSIANLRTELGDIRSGVTSYVDASTSVKGQKIDSATNVFSLKRAAVVTENIRNGLTATINVLEDPTFINQ